MKEIWSCTHIQKEGSQLTTGVSMSVGISIFCSSQVSSFEINTVPVGPFDTNELSITFLCCWLTFGLTTDSYA